jgi:hypothetical protein
MAKEGARLTPGAPLPDDAEILDVKYLVNHEFKGTPEELVQSAASFSMATRKAKPQSASRFDCKPTLPMRKP